jgi:NADH dehydrogenase
VDRDGNAHLIAAAEATGASFILMSVVGASADHPMELFRMKFQAEQRLRASGVAWTIVRSTAFLETWITLLEHTASGSGRPVVFGRGDNPINFVSVVDVAALLQEVVIDPSTRGQVFEIGGPQNLSLNQLAAFVQRAAGRGDAPRHVPRMVLRAMGLVMRPFKPELARQAQAALVMDRGDFGFDAGSAGGTLTTVVDVLDKRGLAVGTPG